MSDAAVRVAEAAVEAACGVLDLYFAGAVEAAPTRQCADPPLEGLPTPYVAARAAYAGDADGRVVFAMTIDGARRLACAMVGAEEPEPGVSALDDMELSAIGEAMNQMMAAAAVAIGEASGAAVEITPAETWVVEPDAALDVCPPSPRATQTELTVQGESCRLVHVFPDAVAPVSAQDPPAPAASRPSLGGITMRVTAELGRTRMGAGRVVSLASGAVVELDADVDAPIDLYVNGVHFATGRLLVTDAGDWAVEVLEVLPHGSHRAVAAPPFPHLQRELVSA